MINQYAETVWHGGLKDGSGSFRFDATGGRYSFASRFEGGEGNTPEELIGRRALDASRWHCRSFWRSVRVHTGGDSHVVDSPPGRDVAYHRDSLGAQAEVPGLDEAEFQQVAELAKKNRPVSKALAGVKIILKSAKLARATAIAVKRRALSSGDSMPRVRRA